MLSKITMKIRQTSQFAVTIVNAVAVLLVVASLVVEMGCQGFSSGNSNTQADSSLNLATKTLSFGSVTAGSNKTLTVLVTNSGNTAASINSASVSSPYSVTAPTLPVSIAAGQSASFSVEFAPTSTGSFVGSLTFSTNVANANLALALSGTGTSASTPQLTVTPSTIAVGSVVDGTSGTASAMLTAEGGSITVSAASVSNSAFSLSGLSLPLTIAAGDSASFTVIFSPTITGAATATLSLTTTALPSVITANLTGTGTAAPTQEVNLSWSASESPDVLGYNIYRAPYTTSCGSYSKINAMLNTGTLYTDASVVSGQAYCYASTAVNTSDEESAYSNIVPDIQIP